MTTTNGHGAVVTSSNGHHVRPEREIIAASPSLRSLLAQLPKIAQSSLAVAIQGETGTGKELIAREIHRLSGRKGPFIGLNCAAIPDNLLESILFGHARGSFSGATYDHPGLMRAASEGTLFLDEIGRMPLTTQVKLMRALQEKEVLPVGETSTVPVNCRIVSATNLDLQEQVRCDAFRQDLYFRLMVLDISIPPLRERREDIPALCQHFLTTNGCPDATIAPEVMAIFMAYRWPGNVRELENALARAAVLSDDKVIRPHHLPRHVHSSSDDNGPPIDFEPISLEEIGRRHCKAVLQYVHGDKKQAAKILDISIKTLYNRIAQYGLQSFAREMKNTRS